MQAGFSLFEVLLALLLVSTASLMGARAMLILQEQQQESARHLHALEGAISLAHAKQLGADKIYRQVAYHLEGTLPELRLCVQQSAGALTLKLQWWESQSGQVKHLVVTVPSQ